MTNPCTQCRAIIDRSFEFLSDATTSASAHLTVCSDCGKVWRLQNYEGCVNCGGAFDEEMGGKNLCGQCADAFKMGAEYATGLLAEKFNLEAT